jgi:hypothetical protein
MRLVGLLAESKRAYGFEQATMWAMRLKGRVVAEDLGEEDIVGAILGFEAVGTMAP